MRNTQNTASGRAILISASCALSLLLLGATAAWATPHYKPGEWKYHWKVHIKMMGLKIPSIPVTVTSCVQGKHPFFNDPKMKKGNCRMIAPKTKGNQFSYTARCGGNGTVVDTHYDLASPRFPGH